MTARQTKHYQPGTVLNSWECEIPSHYGHWPGRCEDKPSPAYEHAVPSSRAELLIITIAETNMALWAGQVNYDKSKGLIYLGRQHGEMNILGKVAVFTKKRCFLL